jgi:hypothetical protein
MASISANQIIKNFVADPSINSASNDRKSPLRFGQVTSQYVFNVTKRRSSRARSESTRQRCKARC